VYQDTGLNRIATALSLSILGHKSEQNRYGTLPRILRLLCIMTTKFLFPALFTLLASSLAAPTPTLTSPRAASCSADVLYQALEATLVSSKAMSFCTTYIAPKTLTRSVQQVPTFLSAYTSATSRLSSACSCLLASQAPVATCTPNACLLLLDTAALANKPVGQDCSSYLRTTVTPTTV